MKKIFLIAILTAVITVSGFAQYFQGTFVNTGNQLSFRLKPTADITTAISYLEVAFRYNTATTPAFTVNNIVSNTANFGGLNMQRLADYSDGTYTYVKFVHNTSTIASRLYPANTELEIFTITVDGANGTFADFDMSSDLINQNYVFGVVDGSGNFLDPGAGDQLYGPGFFTNAQGQFLPLSLVPLPVKFLSFNAVKNNNTALLTWAVENEDANTASYEILKSVNGIDFTSVKTLAPAGNGRSSNTYNFTVDNLSSIRSSGVIYFRIKQIDRDGKAVFTDIKNVRLSGNGLSVAVYPNPVKNAANISFDMEDNAEVSIAVIDALGKQLSVKNVKGFKGANITSVDMSKMASGNYTLKLQTATETKVVPVVKAQN